MDCSALAKWRPALASENTMIVAVESRTFKPKPGWSLANSAINSTGRVQAAEPDAHARIMVGGQILQVGSIQRGNPFETLTMVHFSEQEQRTVRRIASLHWAGIDKFQQAGSQIARGRRR